MGEKLCDVCGEACPLVDHWYMGGATGEYEAAMAKHWGLGYERSQAALVAANEELAKYRARPYATLASDLRAAEADLRAANARADGFKSALELASKAGEQTQRELEEALAAARRECEGLRKALSDLIQEMNFGGGCDGNDPSCDGCVAVEAARAALAAPAAGEEGT